MNTPLATENTKKLLQRLGLDLCGIDIAEQQNIIKYIYSVIPGYLRWFVRTFGGKTILKKVFEIHVSQSRNEHHYAISVIDENHTTVFCHDTWRCAKTRPIHGRFTC